MKSPNVGFREGGSLDPRESASWLSGLGVMEDGVGWFEGSDGTEFWVSGRGTVIHVCGLREEGG